MNLSFIYFSTVTAILILISFRYTNIYLLKNNLVIKLSSFLANTSYCSYLIHTFNTFIGSRYFTMNYLSFFCYILIILFTT